MSPSTGEFGSNPFRLAKVLTPFFLINIVASFVLVLWPVAVPVFCAQFCLLAIWSAWGPGEFWKRFLACLMIGGLLFLSQIYLWILMFAVSSNLRTITVLIQWLFSAWIMAQIPLWAFRYIWQWRITDRADHDLQRFSVNDNMIGISMICVALASCRWATDFLIDQFGPFGFEAVWTFYAWALLEFYFLIGATAFGTWITFRLSHLSAIIVPMLVVGYLFAAISAWLWFPVPERWLATGVLWAGSILFSWSLVLPIHYIKAHGYSLFCGKISVN